MRLLLAAFLTAAWMIPYPLAAQETGQPSKQSPPAATIHVWRHPSCSSCLIAETVNFRVLWCAGDNEVRDLAATCERLSAQSKSAWLGAAKSAAWVPQCDIVVHSTEADYVACMGAHSAQTSGCATLRIEQGRVVLRRIDLCAESLDWQTETLPHELTHVVLADRFSTQRISPWADEGIAMLAETPQKRARRSTALRNSVTSGTTYTVRDLMDVRSFPEPAFRDAFYGQSVSLVTVLLQWGTRKQLLDFVEASQTQGQDAAISTVYGHRSLVELQRQLTESVAGATQTASRD
jgi:peptidase MA superfamily protein